MDFEDIMIKRNKSDKERHTLYDFTFMWNQKQQPENTWAHICRKQTGDCQSRGSGDSADKMVEGGQKVQTSVIK